MPIFMDRHNIPGVTAEHVAQAHQMDLKIQDKYSCRGLTYWFDQKSGAAFCLIEAPNKQAVIDMHNNAHGLVPNQIIEVDSNLVDLFLGRITSPKSTNDIDVLEKSINETAFRTLMFIELKNPFLIIGHTKNFCLNLINDALKKFNGRKIKSNYNGFLVSFYSAEKAVDCAAEIQKEFKAYNNDTSKFKIFFSEGLSTGAPVTENKNDLFEESIQLTKRLTYIAENGQILVSSSVKDLYKKEQQKYSYKNNLIKYLTPLEEKFLNRLMDTTEKVWNKEDFNVIEFGKQIGFSKSHLNRKIVSLTGRSTSEFIKEFRLNRALELILRKEGNISEIAFEAGFNNPSYFSKCFHKQFGVLPSYLIHTSIQ